MVRPESPPCKKRLEDLVLGTFCLRSLALFIVLKLYLWDCSLRVPTDGFDDPIRCAEDVARERLGVGVKADSECCGARILFLCGRVRRGPGCYRAGGTVGQEGGVGSYVGNESVEGRGWVVEDRGGVESLDWRRERVTDEGAGWVLERFLRGSSRVGADAGGDSGERRSRDGGRTKEEKGRGGVHAAGVVSRK